MADWTAGQLESTLRVNNTGAKALEPRNSESNYILIYMWRSSTFKWNRLCMRTLVVTAISCRGPIFGKLQNFWTYLLTWDGLKTRYTTSLPSYLVYIFERVSIAPDEMWKVHKTEIFDHVRASQPERVRHWWRSWREGLKILSYLYPAIPAPCSNSVCFWRYGHICMVSLENFVSGAFSEFLNMVKTSQQSFERIGIDTL